MRETETCFNTHLSLFPFSHSLSDGLLATIGLQSNTDLLVIYLSQGNINVVFDRNSNGINPALILVSSATYHDSLLHHLQVVFSNGQIKMSVDGMDRKLTEGI